MERTRHNSGVWTDAYTRCEYSTITLSLRNTSKRDCVASLLSAILECGSMEEGLKSKRNASLVSDESCHLVTATAICSHDS